MGAPSHVDELTTKMTMTLGNREVADDLGHVSTHTHACDHAHRALRAQEFQMSPTSLSLMVSLASPAPG